MTPMILSVVVATVAITGFLVAVRFRWLSGWSRGFLITIMLALVGISIVSSWLIGTWSYESARRVLTEEAARDLENIGKVAQAQIDGAIRGATERMNDCVRMVAPEAAGNISRQAREELEEWLKGDHRFIQADLYDRRGEGLLAFSRDGSVETINRVAVAYGLEGRVFNSDPYYSPVFKKHLICLSVPVRSASGDVSGVLSTRFHVGEALSRVISATRFGSSGYVVLVNQDGRILAHPEAARVNEDLSSYTAVKLALQGRQGWVSGRNKEGYERIFFYRPLRGPGVINPQPLILLTEVDQGEAFAPLWALRYNFILGMALMAMASLILALQLSHYINQPLHELLPIVERIRTGDLTARATKTGRDEIGRLAGALNEMAAGLQERDRVKELFGRYVTTQISEEVLRGQVNLGGETKRVSILFSDIRNFTSMSEQMSPSQVVGFLNDYFSEMVDAVFEQGGVLDKFIGDGMMAVFGSLGNVPDHPRRAVMTALRMKALLGKINGERNMAGKPPIQIGIGIHTDEVIVGNIGSRKRLEYTCIGDGVNTCARVEALNKEFGTTILITETTYSEVKEHFECRLMPVSQLKGKSRPLQFYEVLSVRAA